MKISILLEYAFVFSVFLPEVIKVSSGSMRLVYFLILVIRILISAYYILRYIVRRELSTTFFITTLFHIHLLVATIYNNPNLGDLRTLFNFAIPNIAIVAYVEYKSCNKNQPMFNVIKRVLEFQVIVNLILMIVAPNGFYVTTVDRSISDTSRTIYTFFLSVKNRVIQWIIPLFLVLCYEESDEINQRERTVFLLVSLISIFFTQSSTSFLIVLTMIILFRLKPKWLRITYWKVIAIGVGATLFIAVFRLQRLFSYIIEDIFQKNLYLQGRTFIWDIVFEKIKDRPFMGYGSAFGGSIITWNGYQWYAHNLFLDIFLQGGLIAILLWTILFLSLVFHERRQERFSDSRNNRNKRTVAICLMMFLLLGVMESFLNYAQFFFVLAAAESTLNSKTVYKL